MLNQILEFSALGNLDTKYSSLAFLRSMLVFQEQGLLNKRAIQNALLYLLSDNILSKMRLSTIFLKLNSWIVNFDDVMSQYK